MKIQIILNYLLMIKLYLILVNSIKIVHSESLSNNNYQSLLKLNNNNNNNNNQDIQLLDCNLNLNNLNYNYQQNNNSNLKRSCYRNNFNRDITLDCKSDKNQEFNKIQNSNFIIDQNINLIIEQHQQDNNNNNNNNNSNNSNNSSSNHNNKIMILEQSFNTYPTGNGSFIINNVNEHIAYFQTLFKLENNIICKDIISEFEGGDQVKMNIQENECNNIKLDAYVYQDPYGKIFNYNSHSSGNINNNNNGNNKNQIIKDNDNNNNQQWNVLDESNQAKSKITYHQNYPFNTIEHLPSNKNLWFKDSIKKMKIGKTIPQLSFSSISGKLISKWIIPNSLEFILLNTTYTHSMGDLVLSGRHIEHNDYKVVDYGLYDIKMLNLNTNEIIPFKRRYF